MRNLKKILALVLALVMSLSLMATAGAAETTAAGTSDLYATAQEVLQGLKIFKGDAGTGAMNFDRPISRVETAALIYRICTSDVEDTQAALYTNHPFTDVISNHWGKGYIAYGYNAEIIKGKSATTFDPEANVTGYETLAMLLRSLGYGKNGEFEGPQWEVQTAATARREGLLNGVSAADEVRLGQPAARGLVAQLLFNALLQPTVKFSALNPYNYEKDATTLGYQRFTLEEVTGVVVANEYAGILRGEKVTTGKNPTAAGKTVLRDADGKVYEVDAATGLDDLGMTRVVYTTKDSKRDNYNKQCLALIDPKTDHVVYDDGEKKDNFNGLGVSATETEKYINFGESSGTAKTNIKVSYVAYEIIDVVSGLDRTDAAKVFRDRYNLSGTADVQLDATYSTYPGSGSYRFIYTPGDNADIKSNTDKNYFYSVQKDANGDWFYRVEIAPKATFRAVDEAVIKSIFYYAGLDRTNLLLNTNTEVKILNGEVYRGTQFVTDYSDTHTYEAFYADCIDAATDHVNDLNSNLLGWRLQVIDNNNDGVSEWVFQTRYTVAKVAKVADDGTLTLDTPNANITGEEVAIDPLQLDSKDGWGGSNHSAGNDNVNKKGLNITAKNESGETLSAGDVVYYASIDGKNYAWKCDVVEGRVSSINRSAKTVTLDGSADPIKESAVHEHSSSTDIASGVVNMSGTVNMKLYMDRYNNLAAFSQNITGSFALLTNGWAKSVISGTEYAVTAWDTASQALKQYNVTAGGNLFIDGTNYYGEGANSWNRVLRFPFLNCNDTDHNPSADSIHTIVAYMESDGENVKLAPVDTVYDVERQNDRGIYMIDMGTTIPGSALEVNTATVHNTTALSGQPYNGRAAATTRVRALSNTVYCYVYQSYVNSTNPNGLYVKQIEGYASGASWLSAADKKYVEDVYVVGTRAQDVNGVYYTANMVVIELSDGFLPTHRDSEQVFIYNTPVVNTWATIEEVEAIRANGAKETIKVDLTKSRTYTEVNGSSAPGTDISANAFEPGLYYLHRTDRTDSEQIWAVERMTHEEIRKAGVYDVGDIVTSYNTLTYNYAQVRDYVCNGCTAGHVVPNMTADSNPYRNAARKNVDGTSKYYTLSYNGSTYPCFGTASEDNAANVLRQWFSPGNTSDLNHNQVLVRYDGSGNIVYAVSFDHIYDGNKENYAQKVWRSVALDRFKNAPEAVTFGTFYGWKFGVDASGDAWVETAGSARAISSTARMDLTYAEATQKTPAGLVVTYTGAKYMTPVITPANPVEGVKDVQIVINYNNTDYTFTFSVEEAHTLNKLTSDEYITVTGSNVTTGKKMTLQAYKDTVEANQTALKAENAKFSWAFYDDKGEIEVGRYNTTNISDSEVIGWSVTVTSEAGVPNKYTCGSVAAAPEITFSITGAAVTVNGTAVANGDKKEYAKGDVLSIEITPDAAAKTKVTVDGAVITAVDGKYTATVTVSASKTIVIKAEDPTAAVVTPTLKLKYIINGVERPAYADTITDIELVAETITLPKSRVELPALNPGDGEISYTVTAGKGVTESGENYVIQVDGTPDSIDVTVTVKVGSQTGDEDEDQNWNWGGPDGQSRMARTLAESSRVWLNGTVRTAAGKMPKEGTEISFNLPASFQVDWSELVRLDDKSNDKYTYWQVYGTIDAADKDKVDLKKVMVLFAPTDDTWTPEETGTTLKIVDKDNKELANYANYVTVKVNGKDYDGQKLEAYNFLTVQVNENVPGIQKVEAVLRVDGKKVSNMYTVAADDVELVLTVTLTADMFVRDENGRAVRTFSKPKTATSLAKYLEQYKMPAGSTVVFHFVDTITNEPFTVTLTTDQAGKTTSDVANAPVRGTQEIGSKIWVELTAVTGEKKVYGDTSELKDAVKVTVTASSAKVAPAEVATEGKIVNYGETLTVTITPETGYTIDMAQFETLKGVQAVKVEEVVTLTITGGKDTTATINVSATKAETVKAEDVTIDHPSIELPEDVEELDVEIVEDTDGSKTTEIPVVVKPLEEGDKKIELIPVVDGKPVEKNEDGTYNLPATVGEDNKVTLAEDEIKLETAPQAAKKVNEAKDDVEVDEVVNEKILGNQAIVLKSATETEGGQPVTDKGDKVTFSSASVVYDENGKAQRVEGIVESADEPVLDDTAKAAGVTVERYVESTKAVAVKWLIKIPCAATISGVVTVTDNKVDIKVTFVIPSDNPDLDKIKAEAKGYVDQFVAWAEKDNSLTSPFFDNDGKTGNEKGEDANFPHNKAISAEVRSSASPLCAYNLEQGINAIKKMITDAADEAAVKAIFWYNPDNTGEAYSCMGWDSTATDSDMCKNFGVTGNLKSYIQEELQMMNVKQSALDKFDATTTAGQTAKATILSVKADTNVGTDENRGTLRMASAVKKIANAASEPTKATAKAEYINALKAISEGFEVNYKAVKAAYGDLEKLYPAETPATLAAEAAKFEDVWDSTNKTLKNHEMVIALDEAVATAKTGKDELVADEDGKITLLVDQILTETWYVTKFTSESESALAEGETLTGVNTLDLNGHSIKYHYDGDESVQGSAILIKGSDANLTITGTGTIEATGTWNEAIVLSSTATSGISLTIDEGVVVKAPDENSIGVFISKFTEEGPTPNVTIKGRIEAYVGVNVHGEKTNEGNLQILGTIDAADVGIYQSGRMNTVFGAKSSVTGLTSAIEIAQGTLQVFAGATVNGGSGKFEVTETPEGGGSIVRGAAIAVTCSKDTNNTINVEIMRGAKITGDEYKVAVVLKDLTTNTGKTVNVKFDDTTVGDGEWHIDNYAIWNVAEELNKVTGGINTTITVKTAEESTPETKPATFSDASEF